MMTVGNVKAWLSEELTPFAWQRILIRLLPVFRDEGYYYHNISDEEELSDKLVEEINRTLSDMYQVSLPVA